MSRMVEQALEGVKVADFSWSLAGPYATEYLALHGATIVRVENPQTPDVLRWSAPYKDNIPGPNRGGSFDMFNANKYGMALDLNNPKGLEVAKRLISWSDVVAESFAPGTMKRWGLDYEGVRQIKPDIIMISSSQLGQTGPQANRAGLGVQLAGLSGFMYYVGWPDREPSVPVGAYTDATAPRIGAMALLAALDYRRRTGKGQYIDISQFEVGIHFLAPLILDYEANRRIGNRIGNRSALAVPHGAYPCKGNDRWCVVAVFGDNEWNKLCCTMGNPEWTKSDRFSTMQSRKENEDELDVLMAEWTIKSTAEEIMTKLQAEGLTAGIAYTLEDIYKDSQLIQRHRFWDLEHPEIGTHPYHSVAFRLSKTPCELYMASPCIGQHTEYVCTEILGMSDNEFVELLNENAFGS